LKADLQQNLNKKEEQVQKYASKILKLETKCKNNEMTLNQQQKTIETLKLENERLNEENKKLKDDLYQQEQTKQTESENHTRDRKFKIITRQNEELRSQVAWYEKEHDIMSQKLSVLSHQIHNQSSLISKDVTGIAAESVKKKETVAKSKVVSGINEQSLYKSTSSNLQECKDWCAGSNSRSNLQQMKNKILFAESKRNESKSSHKDPSNHDRDTTAVPEQPDQNHNILNNQRHQPANSFEAMAKLSSIKQSVSQTTLMKQKSLIQAKKPLIHKGLKKNPRWVRKPLR
jgi:hypothetical protein